MTQRTGPAPQRDLLSDAQVATTDLEDAAAELVAVESQEDSFDAIDQARLKLEIFDAVPDVTIAASLAQIASRSDPRERWLAAFASPLGKFLAQRGGDLNSALNVLLALAPRRN